MDKPAIKKFAIWARNKLIADTKYRAGLVGVTETAVAEPLPQSNENVQFFDVGLPQPYRIEDDAVTQRQRFVAELNKETAKQGSYTAAYQTVVDQGRLHMVQPADCGAVYGGQRPAAQPHAGFVQRGRTRRAADRYQPV